MAGATLKQRSAAGELLRKHPISATKTDGNASESPSGSCGRYPNLEVFFIEPPQKSGHDLWVKKLQFSKKIVSHGEIPTPTNFIATRLRLRVAPQVTR